MDFNYGKTENLPKKDISDEESTVFIAKENRKKRELPVALIVVLMLVVPLLVLLVYEPGRFRVWVDGMSIGWLQAPVSKVVTAAEWVHSALGLSKYKDAETDFLDSAKTSPDIFAEDTGQDNGVSGEETQAGLEGAFIGVEKPYTVLVVGDSLVLEGYGPILESRLSAVSEVEVVRKGKYSTGLSRPDYFDWNVYIVELIEKYSPSVIVVMFGANDGQNFTVDGKAVEFDTEQWRAEYSARADRFMEILDGYEIVTFWVGNPIAKSDYYTHKMEVINTAVETAAVNHPNVHYVSTWETLKDSSGRYSDYLPDANGKMKLARANDGIHCTAFGGGFLVDRTLEVMGQYIEF